MILVIKLYHQVLFKRYFNQLKCLYGNFISVSFFIFDDKVRSSIWVKTYKRARNNNASVIPHANNEI